MISSSTRQRDWGEKRRAYHRAGVPFYWLLDPESGMLTVLRRVEEDYLVALVAVKGDAVRAPPFDSVELLVSELLGEEEAEEPDAEAPPPEETP